MKFGYPNPKLTTNFQLTVCISVYLPIEVLKSPINRFSIFQSKSLQTCQNDVRYEYTCIATFNLDFNFSLRKFVCSSSRYLNNVTFCEVFFHVFADCQQLTANQIA